MIAAAGLDLLVGDPRWSPHPVEAMGRVITRLRESIEAWAGDRALSIARRWWLDHLRFGFGKRRNGLAARETDLAAVSVAPTLGGTSSRDCPR